MKSANTPWHIPIAMSPAPKAPRVVAAGDAVCHRDRRENMPRRARRSPGDSPSCRASHAATKLPVIDATITSHTALLASWLFSVSVQLGQFRQVPQLLQVPEQKGPMSGQREAANQQRQHGDAPHRSAEQIGKARGRRRPIVPWPPATLQARARRGESTAPRTPAARRPGRRSDADKRPARNSRGSPASRPD